MRRRAAVGAVISSLLAGSVYFQARGMSTLLYCQMLSALERTALPAAPAAPASSEPAPTPRAAAMPNEQPIASAARERLAPAPLAPPALSTREPIRNWLGKVRIVPQRVSGRVLGLGLSGIEPGSALALLGLQNGDRLDAIGSGGKLHALSGAESALRAYLALANERDIELSLTRAGEPIKLVYHLR